jgi:hypothetical protein
MARGGCGGGGGGEGREEVFDESHARMHVLYSSLFLVKKKKKRGKSNKIGCAEPLDCLGRNRTWFFGVVVGRTGSSRSREARVHGHMRFFKILLCSLILQILCIFMTV